VSDVLTPHAATTSPAATARWQAPHAGRSERHAIPALADARDESRFGGKAVQLGALLRARLPVPDGFAIAWDVADAIAGGDQDAIGVVLAAARSLGGPVAVRSSAIGEDSADASFAGVHATLLNVLGEAALLDAIRAVHASGSSDSALAYRREHAACADRPRIGIVVQRFLDAQVSGVLFTRNPVTGADERVIEASWGLGESIVGGLVTPDHLRVSRSGTVCEMRVGEKDFAIVASDAGGTRDRSVAAAVATMPCLTDERRRELLALTSWCEELELAPQDRGIDLEWCVFEDEVRLLQLRPMTA
jgi:pyruvate,water dikinase